MTDDLYEELVLGVMRRNNCCRAEAELMLIRLNDHPIAQELLDIMDKAIEIMKQDDPEGDKEE